MKSLGQSLPLVMPSGTVKRPLRPFTYNVLVKASKDNQSNIKYSSLIQKVNLIIHPCIHPYEENNNLNIISIRGFFHQWFSRPG